MADLLLADHAAGSQVLARLGDSCALLVGFGLGVDRCVPQERRQAERAQVGQRLARGVLVELVDQVVEIIFDGYETGTFGLDQLRSGR